MDPLQDVLSVVGATSYLSTGMVAGGDWAVRFEAPLGVKFNSVQRGRCRLRVEGMPAPLDLGPGDCFLLTQPRAFTLASDLDRPAVPAAPIFAAAGPGPARAGTGEDVLLLGGGFVFNERARTVLLQNLPPVVHIPAGLPEAELAAVSRVSRSSLAARFKQVVGQGPLEYLTAWRIELASQRLRQGTQTLDRIAREVGYGSESALSTAFKRVVGVSPREYRRRGGEITVAS